MSAEGVCIQEEAVQEAAKQYREACERKTGFFGPPVMDYEQFVKVFFGWDFLEKKYLPGYPKKGSVVKCTFCSEDFPEREGWQMDVSGIRFQLCYDHLRFLFCRDMSYPG